MLKLLGILIIISVSTLYGFRASAALREREKKLGLYIRLISETEDKIRQKQSLEDIFSDTCSSELLKYENYTVNFSKSGLLKDDIKLLEDFFASLGFGDIKSQTELCRTYKELLYKKEKEAEQETSQKAKLYSVLGFFSGLFVAVMLI